ncbi:BamA/TamA family outer membrane protein [Lewinella cohaerens]|uniref:BamA/TamA family outer membrane protein n=1 Tax=Lewinella cohaerens TaxID=70995 RepID=UPI00037F6171|nr:BamA/TamA family outer membrane protein [Lewinella cohaerens]
MRAVILSIFVVLLTTFALTAQESTAITIDKISVIGQKRTRLAVIFRELPIKVGDTISLANLPKKIAEAERQLMNTNLFSKANITYKDWEGATQKVHLQVELLENWYIYPVPTFDLADRNFNVWWKEQNRSLQRVNIGLEVNHLNFTGWGDKIEVGFEYGYTRSYSGSYKIPYINKKQTLGLAAGLSYSRNREVNYATVDNKQEFYRDDARFLRRFYKFESSLTWRPAIYAMHTFGLEFHQEWIDPLVIQDFNPDYFGGNKNEISFFRLLYRFAYDFRDNRAYPWSGHIYGAELLKDGVGIFNDRSSLTLDLFGSKYWPIGERWSFGLVGGGKYSFIRQPQAYRYNRALGFGRSKLSGYELYLLDGLDAAYLRKSVRFNLWKGNITFGKWVFLESFRELPFHFNLSMSSDMGYANSPFNTQPNPLNNEFLWGGGIGIDLVFYYDFVLRLQYSANKIGDRGFFLDFELGI